MTTAEVCFWFNYLKPLWSVVLVVIVTLVAQKYRRDH